MAIDFDSYFERKAEVVDFEDTLLERLNTLHKVVQDSGISLVGSHLGSSLWRWCDRYSTQEDQFFVEADEQNSKILVTVVSDDGYQYGVSIYGIPVSVFDMSDSEVVDSIVAEKKLVDRDEQLKQNQRMIAILNHTNDKLREQLCQKEEDLTKADYDLAITKATLTALEAVTVSKTKVTLLEQHEAALREARKNHGRCTTKANTIRKQVNDLKDQIIKNTDKIVEATKAK